MNVIKCTIRYPDEITEAFFLLSVFLRFKLPVNRMDSELSRWKSTIPNSFYPYLSFPWKSIPIASSMFLLLTKSITWFFHYCCSLPLLLLLSTGKSSSALPSSILRRCPYHFSCLLWILSKTDYSACIWFLMVLCEIFCNMDTLTDLLKIAYF